MPKTSGQNELPIIAFDSPVVITGVAGFIGSKAAEILLASGVSVLGIDCLLPDLYPNDVKKSRIQDLSNFPNFSFYQKDLRFDDVSALISQTSVVLHFAAMAGLKKSWTNPESYESNNAVGTLNLLKAISSSGNPHLVHASTSSVYGKFAIGDEKLAVNPVSPYGVTKLQAENFIHEFEQSQNMSATILRYFSVYGPRQRPDMAYSIFCNSILRGDVLRVTGDGSQSRSNTYVDDAAFAAVLAGILKPQNTMNVSGADTISLLEAIHTIEDALGKKAVLEFVPQVKGDQQTTSGDTTLARNLLSWQPRMNIYQGLKLQSITALADFENQVQGK